MGDVRTFVDEGLGHSSYLIDLGDGGAAIVDPPRFPIAHLATARALGAVPRWTIDTHSHADYVTGSPGLVTDHGVTFVAPAASRLETPHHGVTDDERVVLGRDVALCAIGTPGHTPDHHAYLLERNGEPTAVFTGGSLMVGAVGRTDLCGPELTEPLAHDMFHSLRRFATLPDDIPVYPTHGAGSFCSAPGGTDRTSTLGRERATNTLFGLDDEDLFVERLLNGLGTFPTYFARLPELNRRGPRPLRTLPRLERLDVDRVERHVDGGAVVVDTRSVDRFGHGHIPGSIADTLRPVFASWVGWTVEPDRPIVIVADDDQDRDDIVRQCLDIGHDELVGELAGGVDAWRAAGGSLAAVAVVGAPEIAAENTGTLIDVRQHSEFVAGHVPRAINIELGSLIERAADLPSRPVTLMCGHGERAMTGASLLARIGRNDLTVVTGGPDSWAAATGRRLQVGS